MRLAVGSALLLGACSPHAEGASAQVGKRIDCALASAASFSHDCTVERDGASLLIVHHPDGGFRRFKLVDGGKSLVAADGSEALAIARSGDRLDVGVDGDRYRFPASMLSDDGGH